MDNLYLYTSFNHKTNKPLVTVISYCDQFIIKELYNNSGKSIYQIQQTIESISSLILKVEQAGGSIILSNFKNHLKHFSLPLRLPQYRVYDLQLPNIVVDDYNKLQPVVEQMKRAALLPHHLITANASVVYQAWEAVPLIINSQSVIPNWETSTFSGRSKSIIQGLTDNDDLIIGGKEFDDIVYLHFDWVCADIRIASLLSNDIKLKEAFIESDPYIYMMNMVNDMANGEAINRDECKTHLLKSINSMDVDSMALTEIYPDLGRWIKKCKQDINTNGKVKSILGRWFKRQDNRNDLALLNGVMQGSVAHAMQHTIRRLWERLGNRLICEIHDSLVLWSLKRPSDIKATINTTIEVMLRPFFGILDDNPVFPVKVSIGSRWRHWKAFEIHRESSVHKIVL